MTASRIFNFRFLTALLVFLPAGAWAGSSDSTHAVMEWYLGLGVLPTAFFTTNSYTREAIGAATAEPAGIKIFSGWKRKIFPDSSAGAEFCYARTQKNVFWHPLNNAVSADRLSWNLKWYFLTQNPFQPYVQTGMNLTMVRPPASVSPAVWIQNARDWGLGANLGSGMLWYLHPRCALQGGAVYHMLGWAHSSQTFALGSTDGHGDLEITLSVQISL